MINVSKNFKEQFVSGGVGAAVGAGAYSAFSIIQPDTLGAIAIGVSAYVADRTIGRMAEKAFGGTHKSGAHDIGVITGLLGAFAITAAMSSEPAQNVQIGMWPSEASTNVEFITEQAPAFIPV